MKLCEGWIILILKIYLQFPRILAGINQNIAHIENRSHAVTCFSLSNLIKVIFTTVLYVLPVSTFLFFILSEENLRNNYLLGQADLLYSRVKQLVL